MPKPLNLRPKAELQEEQRRAETSAAEALRLRSEALA